MPPSSPSRPTNPSQVSGNAPDSIKQFLLHSLDAPKRMPVFAPHIHLGLVLSEVSIYPAPEDPLNQQMRVVLRIEVDESMLDLADSVFGGCIAYLIDYCSSLSVAALRTAFLGDSSVNVSQSLAIAYHAQAMCGDKLRIVNTSVISTGGDNGSPPMAMNAKAEVCLASVVLKDEALIVATSGTDMGRNKTSSLGFGNPQFDEAFAEKHSAGEVGETLMIAVAIEGFVDQEIWACIRLYEAQMYSIFKFGA
ncbi:hypothetical protein WG66_007689 [Moniliophthora roreri]|nr:hypothetical protein WG66_007689 [Moniliophthora roreri]